ncbi:hypothetical protein [Sphingomonas sp. GC_Shp_3]|uniref:hypothetical protein n=1 Tax=Sphingomonas sp. GC_Shp_3 TaxID=2937383 RepID=UPI00226A44F6|nr:hypothetical protein [Sphingomonas sp. GC_Shp_3]
MTGHIHSRFRTVSASLLLDTLGRSLATIKREDEATDADLGAVLGKSPDRAEAYRKGAGDMGVVSFLRACGKWDGRFANDALALVGMKLIPIETGEGADREIVTALAELLAKVGAAVERDGNIHDDKLADMSRVLNTAGKHIDRLRDRRRPALISSN